MPSDFLPASIVQPLIYWLWRTSWPAAAVAILVLILRASVGRLMTLRGRHALWALVLLRLLLPVTANSRLSMFAASDFFRNAFTARSSTFFEHSSIDDSLPGSKKVIIQYGPVPKFATVPAAKSSVQDHSMLPVVAVVWLIGAFFFITRLVVVNILFFRHLGRSSRIADPRLIELMATCCREMRIARPPRLLLTDIVTTPAVTGLWCNRLLMPPGLGDQLSGEQLRLIFLHELAHVQCFDISIDWLWGMLQAVHWFNPVLWFIGPLRRADREQARDEMVLLLSRPADAGCYGRTILDLAQLARPLGLCAGLIGIMNRRKNLEKRINMIAKFTPPQRGLRVTGLLLVLLTGCVALTNPEAKEPPTTSPSSSNTLPAPEITTSVADSSSPQEMSVRAALDRRVTEVAFNGNNFSDVIDYLRDVSGINIYVDWATLERAKISRDAPVTAKLRDIKMSKVLELVFKTVEGGTDDHKLGYVIDDGVLTISTREELNKNVVTERYDINDMLFVPPSYINKPDIDAQVPSTREGRIETLKKFIMDNVAPTSWKSNGGTVGTINSSPLRAILLITQTPENQRKIRQVLDGMRASQTMQVSVATRFITLDEAGMAKLSDALRSRLADATHSKASPADNFLSDAEANELIEAVQRSRKGTSLTAPRLTLFSGQRASIKVMSDQPYIASMSAVVQKKGNDLVTSYEPHINNVNTVGVESNVLATVTPDRKNVLLDVHDIFTRLDSLEQEHWSGAPAEANIFVQRPILSTCELHVCQAVPDGATLLIGEFSQSGPAPTTMNSKNSGVEERIVQAAQHHQLYSLVTVKIIDINAPAPK